mgnify:CR=1 FL=1
MKLSGNKGEWSELYVLLKLLSTGELYAADEKLQKIKDVYYPILKIIRQEDENKHLEYVIVSEECRNYKINYSKGDGKKSSIPV